MSDSSASSPVMPSPAARAAIDYSGGAFAQSHPFIIAPPEQSPKVKPEISIKVGFDNTSIASDTITAEAEQAISRIADRRIEEHAGLENLSAVRTMNGGIKLR